MLITDNSFNYLNYKFSYTLLMSNIMPIYVSCALYCTGSTVLVLIPTGTIPMQYSTQEEITNRT